MIYLTLSIIWQNIQTNLDKVLEIYTATEVVSAAPADSADLTDGEGGDPPDELHQRTRAEIEAIAAEFHDRLSRESAESIGAIYARYTTRFQQSIGDQVRSLFEEAERLKIFIPVENVFFDTAAKGYSSRRPGHPLHLCAFEDRHG